MFVTHMIADHVSRNEAALAPGKDPSSVSILLELRRQRSRLFFSRMPSDLLERPGHQAECAERGRRRRGLLIGG
jgi:hypothetical protein